jgi:ABC-type phosphate transport system substrate-binding protein
MTRHHAIATMLVVAALTGACSNGEPRSASGNTASTGATPTTQASVRVLPAAQRYVDAVNAKVGRRWPDCYGPGTPAQTPQPTT